MIPVIKWQRYLSDYFRANGSIIRDREHRDDTYVNSPTQIFASPYSCIATRCVSHMTLRPPEGVI